MASLGFAAILEKLATKQNKGRNGKVTTEVDSDIVSKGLEMKASFIARMDESIAESEILNSAEEAALQSVYDLLDDVVLVSDPKIKNSRTKAKVNIPAQIFGLRRASGAVTNAISLSQRLNLILVNYIKDNMGKDGALVYRTGRFANSAYITEISSPEKTLDTQASNTSIYFTYMVAPYSVFETSGRSNGGARSPDKLIRKSLREAITIGLKGWLNPSSIELASGFKVKGV